MSYTFDFGDGSYVLTTCSEATHVYTRVGYFHVKASARTNVSGPIMGSTWVLIQSSLGKMTLDYPQGIVETENETEIVVSISQGTWMEATFITPAAKRTSRKFNISGKTGCKWQGLMFYILLSGIFWHNFLDIGNIHGITQEMRHTFVGRIMLSKWRLVEITTISGSFFCSRYQLPSGIKTTRTA